VINPFIIYNSYKNWKARNYLYEWPETSQISLTSPLATDTYRMPSGSIRRMRATRGHKQLPLYAITCRGVCIE